MGPKFKSNSVLMGVVFLLCAALIALGWLMGSNTVFAVDPSILPAAAEESAPLPEETETPTPADEALLVTEQVERVAMRVAVRGMQPVTRTVAVGLDVQNATGTVSCTFVPVYVDGVFGGYSYVVNGKAYISLPEFCGMIGEDCTVDAQEDNTVQYTAAGAPVTVTANTTTFTANGRYIDAQDGTPAMDGKLLIPLASLQTIFGASVEYDTEDASVAVDTSTKELIESGESYYARQDLYWLSRIIYAEANGQPFDGMIGVGNVVLNRVNSSRFPNTVEAVVFEPGQFTPVDNGSIYNTPSAEAIRAAQMCIDGVNTVGNSLFFVNPSACDSSWFQYSLTYVTTIGGHVFYA